MKKRQGVGENPCMGGVIYLRVSYDEQVDPVNIGNQEQKCRCYCNQKGINVLQAFIDPGESARTADRPEFQRMLAFCKAHRREVGYVVVQDLSRFARNNRDQAQFISELTANGVKLCSVYEPNVDDTAAGKLAANIHGTFNQYFSDALSEKMKDRMRAAVMAGRFPWPAPIGYLNDSKTRTGANLIPDPERAPHIRKAFELMATGNYKKTTVLKIVTEDGLRTRKGKKLSAQTFEETLKKPVYCGYIMASCLDAPVKASHEPLVSEGLFRTVQDVLSGNRLSIAPKRRSNPEFPLKCFVRCSACGTPLTGGFATGKNKSHKFRYYWCRQPGCRAVFVRGEALEELFVEHLRALQPDEELVSDFLRTAEESWKQQRGDAEANAVKLKGQLEEQKRMKSELLRAKLRGEVTQADYAQANAELNAEGFLLAEKIAVNSEDRSFGGFIRFGKAAMADFVKAWQRATGDQKSGVQTLVFQDGLLYSSESRKFEHLNPHLFSIVAGGSSNSGWLASPTGFEPVLPP